MVVTLPRRGERRTFASLSADLGLTPAGSERRVVTLEAFMRRRSARLAEPDRSRGRREFARDEGQPSERFRPDGSVLSVWARDHLVCCRKLARRILALVELDRADEAGFEAQRFATVESTRWDRPKSRACQVSEPLRVSCRLFGLSLGLLA